MLQDCRFEGQADAPAAVRGEFEAVIDFRHFGPHETTICYELVGTGGPLLIVAGGISADRHLVASPEFPEAGWWQAQADVFAPNRNRILAIDWLGADGSIDQPIDPADQAQAFALTLDHLGHMRCDAFVGASYGAMVGMHLAALHSNRIGRLLAFCAAHRAHPFASALRSVQRRAIALAETLGDANDGVALARSLAMIAYRSPQEFEQRFAAAPVVRDGAVEIAADSYLTAQGERIVGRLGAVAYRRLSESIDLHAIEPRSIRCPVTLAGADTDQLVPLADVEALAAALPGSEIHVIRSLYGHDAFLKEAGQVGAILSSSLCSLGARS
jgi:homoserine O-acetyltransferase